MYGTSQDTKNWDLMLEGTIESILEMPECDGMNHDYCSDTEKEMVNKLLTSMVAMVGELELDKKQCQTSLKECNDQIEMLKSRSTWWMNKLELLRHSITEDPDMKVNLGRSDVGEGDQHHVTNKSTKQCNNSSLLACPEKRGDFDRRGGVFLASRQGPDDNVAGGGGHEILNRIDHSKNKNVASASAFVSSGNQEPFRSLIMSPPSLGTPVKRGTKEEEADHIRAKLSSMQQQQPSRQLQLPGTLEATSLLETTYDQW